MAVNPCVPYKCRCRFAGRVLRGYIRIIAVPWRAYARDRSCKLDKTGGAFRTISEAAAELAVPQHVLRHWEDVFGHLRPMRRAGGRRYYRPADIDLLRGIRILLYERQHTTKGVRKIFREKGIRYVLELGKQPAPGMPSGTVPGSGLPLAPEVRMLLENLLLQLEEARESLGEAMTALEKAGSGTPPVLRKGDR